MADLTTLENVKDYMQITDTSSDIVLARLISAFSQHFLSQVNRGALLSATYQESRNGTGGDLMNVLYYPLTAVNSLTVNGINVPASPDGVQAGFVFDQFTIWIVGSVPGFVPVGGVRRFTRGRQNVQINYIAGYAATPLDVEQAVIDQVTFTLRRSTNLGTTAQTMQGALTTSFSQKDLAPGVQLVINAYRNRAVVGI
jgi:hypothetical protein